MSTLHNKTYEQKNAHKFKNTGETGLYNGLQILRDLPPLPLPSFSVPL